MIIKNFTVNIFVYNVQLLLNDVVGGMVFAWKIETKIITRLLINAEVLQYMSIFKDFGCNAWRV
jgi:hypothetical protein